MTRYIGALLTLALLCGLTGVVQSAGAQDATATLDKAIQALGGATQLSAVKAVSYTANETLMQNGRNTTTTTKTIVLGYDHYRQEMDGMARGNKIRGILVLAGDQGARIFNTTRTDLSGDALANLKRTAYLTAIPMTILPLKSNDFKVQAIPDINFENRPAAGIDATGPDGKDFKLYFDKQTGLPVAMVAKVAGPQGQEFMQETIYSNYKTIAGIKKAMKLVYRRNNANYQEVDITDWKVVENVAPNVFTGQ